MDDEEKTQVNTVINLIWTNSYVKNWQKSAN